MKKSNVVFAVSMMIVGGFLVVIIHSFLTALPVCGERTVKYPAVIRNVDAIDVTMDASICNQIVAMESEDPDLTDCHYQAFDSGTAPFGLVSVSRKNTCSAYGDSEAFMSYFYGIVTAEKIYPLNYFNSGIIWTYTPDTPDEFPTISKAQNEELADYLVDSEMPASSYVHMGEYLHYWGKSQGISCLEMDIPQEIQSHCLFAGIDDMYFDEDKTASVTSYMQTLLETYGSCEGVGQAIDIDNKNGSSANVRTSVVNDVCEATVL